jgi:transcriptional regulator with XRE-family HTH domain
MSKPIEACHVAVGARIRIIREALGMSQAELAKRTGMQRASLANLETGRQRLLLDGVERYAAALGTSPKQLLKGVWW